MFLFPDFYKIEDYIGSTEINIDVPEDFKIAFNNEEKIQIYMGAKKLKEENMVLASSGIYHDSDELRRLVASSGKPIFVVTGKTLTERPEDLDDSNDHNGN